MPDPTAGTPRTDAGRRLLDWFGGPMRPGEKHNLLSAILAIEAEALRGSHGESRLRKAYRFCQCSVVSELPARATDRAALDPERPNEPCGDEWHEFCDHAYGKAHDACEEEKPR